MATKKATPGKKPAKTSSADKAKPVKAKPVAKAKAKPAAKPVPKKPAPTSKVAAPKQAASKVESALMISGAKFVKMPFFFDAEKEYGSKYKHGVLQKLPEKPTACSRIKISGPLDGKNLVEILSQQLEHENRTYFEGCEGQICVKCNKNNVDPKYYVDKSLGHCTECAELLGLGQSKEGVFSDAQMELMRRSIEKSMENAKDMDEDDIESALLDDMDSLEQEELLAIVEETELNA
jgi:hypothetical protein